MNKYICDLYFIVQEGCETVSTWRCKHFATLKALDRRFGHKLQLSVKIMTNIVARKRLAEHVEVTSRSV